MFPKTGERMHQGIDKPFTQRGGRPFLEHADIDLVTDDRKMSVEAGPNINICSEDFHSIVTFKYSRSGHLNAGPRFPPNSDFAVTGKTKLIYRGFPGLNIEMGTRGKYMQL